MDPQQIKIMIENGLEGASANVVGDGRHFEAIVVCDAFDGKSMVEQHQMVYQALGANMEEAIHALSMKTMTHEQFKLQQSG